MKKIHKKIALIIAVFIFALCANAYAMDDFAAQGEVSNQGQPTDVQGQQDIGTDNQGFGDSLENGLPEDNPEEAVNPEQQQDSSQPEGTDATANESAAETTTAEETTSEEPAADNQATEISSESVSEMDTDIQDIKSTSFIILICSAVSSAVSALALIISIIVLILVVGLRKNKNDREEDDEYDPNEAINNLSEAVTAELGGIRHNINKINEELTSRDSFAEKSRADLRSRIDKISMSANNQGKPSHSAGRPAPAPVKKQTTLSKYNDYLANKTDSLPEGFELTKVSISGVKPMISDDGSAELYFEGNGSKYNIYPKKEFLTEDLLPYMGTDIFKFKKAGNGIKRVNKPAVGVVSGNDNTIDIEEKGEIYY
ncbi:MAG: hypothetical protein LUC97_09800 [Clostridiales bacterium]|nr:hypothetical protein [Clostridiales bacterium]